MSKWIVEGEVTIKVRVEVEVEAEDEFEAESKALNEDLLFGEAWDQLNTGSYDEEGVEVIDVRPAKE